MTFGDDALLAYWDGDGEETAPRTLARGADANGLLRRAEVLVSVEDGANRLLEGRDGDRSFAASLQLDAPGAITRALVYHTTAIEPSPTWGTAAETPADAGTVLDTYFWHLEHGRMQAAADCFSADCLYSHPPYGPGQPRVEFRGRDELLAGFTKRGPRPWAHELLVVIQRGAECLLEGRASGTERGGSFISSLSLDGDGRIRRYAAFYCEPPVPRR